jgi:endonuclease G, mitochondrial
MADISTIAAAPGPSAYESAVREANEAAARRVRAQTAERTDKIARMGAVGLADTPERLAKRADRLRRYRRGEQLRSAPVAVPVPDSETMAVGGVGLEKVINSADFVDIRYLEGGVAASRAVGRIDIGNEMGRVVGYGTGSMVSKQLILTNHHVLPTGDVARWSSVEFNYQDGIDGQPLQPKRFRLDPDRFFLADKELDFALVAVAGDPSDLAAFGLNRLLDAEGKAVVGEFVTIVQHPKGEKKQISLRENRVVDVLDSFLHYETDTEAGSSGSPVFNDQWEVVALHHACVPAPEHAELGRIINEGIRVSALLKGARAAARQLSAPMAAVFDGLFQDERGEVAVQATPAPVVVTPEVVTRQPGPQSMPSETALRRESAPAPQDGGIRLTVPVEITFRLGTPPPAAAEFEGPPAVVLALPVPTAVEPGEEAIQIDPDYGDREGYDAGFLGGGSPDVPLPALPEDLLAIASVNAKPGAGPTHVLPYHHFSVVMNKERALAFFTAVNIDGNLSQRLRREPDRWTLDPRIPATEQTGEAVYARNDLDRGHLVRRLDPAWGTSQASAKAANDDTFHFTNCSPQHKDFNQNHTTWAGLEDYVLENADNRDLKVNVFSGPVFAPDDDVYRGVQLPRQFWKVVVMARTDGTLSATAYLLSQATLIEGLESVEEFSYGAYRTFQVPVTKVEELTGLSFGPLVASDPLARLESTDLAREVVAPGDVVL